MDVRDQLGRYHVLTRIARGGTAEIYRARYRTGNTVWQEAAIKVLLPEFCGHEELREMLGDEGRLLARLTHSGIVQLIEIGCDAELPFLAMEYVEGIDLARLLTRLLGEQKPLPAAQTVTIMTQILAALDYAHRRVGPDGVSLGLVHRDISPSNLLLSWHGEVKLADFGIARGTHRSRDTSLGLIRGKCAYMAPEQARGEAIDARTDLFACGIVLAELLLARRFFGGGSDAEVQQRVAAAAYSFDAFQLLPAPLRQILILSLSPDPEQRYQSAAEMLGDVMRAARLLQAPPDLLGLAGYLRHLFPDAYRTPLLETTVMQTEVMEAVSVPRFLLAESSPARWWRTRISTHARAGLLAVVVAFMTLFNPGHGTPPLAHAETHGVSVEGEAVAAISGEAADQPLPEPVTPPQHVSVPRFLIRGAISIESVPPQVSGVLRLGEKRLEITTPFSLSDIDLTDVQHGTVTLQASGYKDVSEDFVLRESSPTFLKRISLERESKATLRVTAIPWGIVTIDGVARGETPVALRALEGGDHTVRVTYPPTREVLTQRLHIDGSAHRQCRARFDGKAKLACR